MADIKFIVECDTSKGVASIKELDKNIGQHGPDSHSRNCPDPSRLNH
jgi:hypothetical protein